MNNFDLKSMRFIGILIFICLVFALVVWQAFSYLPSESDVHKNDVVVTVPSDDDTDVESEQSDDEDVTQDDEDDSDEDADDENEDDFNEENSGEPAGIDNAPTKLESDEKFDVIEDPADLSENTDDIIKSALNYREQKNYVAAINNYEKAIGQTSDIVKKAECNEQISMIYAIMKRYGTALSYAQKAYNLSPSSSRELLLAKLNYKTGNVDKANGQMSAVLNGDFSFDK